jgi:selenide,water dikinase
MNLLAFPCKLDPSVVAEVMRGGAEKVVEAGAITVGGHTIDDDEPKYGLSVLGVVHPDRVVRNSTAQPGDALFLTKPIGTGVIGTAIKRGLLTEDDAREVIETMARLNKAAGEAMVEAGVDAGTDVTGFGLLGHLHEMCKGSGCAARLVAHEVPTFEGALDFAANGVWPGRTKDVRAFAERFTDWRLDPDDAGGTADGWWNVLCDPQTSGGMLVAVPQERAHEFTDAIEARGEKAWWIGETMPGDPGRIVVE